MEKVTLKKIKDLLMIIIPFMSILFFDVYFIILVFYGIFLPSLIFEILKNNKDIDFNYYTELNRNLLSEIEKPKIKIKTKNKILS